MKYKHYDNEDEHEQAKDNGYIETRYIGKSAHLLGKKGECYFNVDDDQWYFRPKGDEDWYRVKDDSLDCIGVN